MNADTNNYSKLRIPLPLPLPLLVLLLKKIIDEAFHFLKKKKIKTPETRLKLKLGFWALDQV